MKQRVRSTVFSLRIFDDESFLISWGVIALAFTQHVVESKVEDGALAGICSWLPLHASLLVDGAYELLSYVYI